MTAEETSAPRSRDDPIARTILDLLAAGGAVASIAPTDAARAFAAARARPKDPPDLWRRYMHAVRQQMVHLARQGRIEIVRRGRPVDPNDFKGVVRLRLPPGD